VKPLLDALADDKEAQQKIAIEVLAYVENKSAGPALYNFATGPADKNLRVRAMLAVGALRDPAMLPRFEAMLAPKEGTTQILPSDSIAVAAAWGVARMAEAGPANADPHSAKKAEPLLLKLLGSGSPDVRALAAVGLGLTHDRRHAPVLAALAASPEAGPLARAAATHALAELGAADPKSAAALVPPGLLLGLADATDPLLRQAALLAMARLGDKADLRGGGAAEAIAAGAFSREESLRSAAVSAAATLSTRGYKRTREALPVPDGPLTLRDVLLGLAPDEAGPNERAAALVALGPALQRAAVAAVATSPERARLVADALLSGDGATLALAPFTDARAKLDDALAKQVAATVESLAAAVVPGFVALERHPDVEVRTRAVELLARRPEAEAQAAVIDALSDPDESVRRTALSAIGPVKHAPTIAAVASLLQTSTSWPLRVRASEALGRLGQGGADPSVVDTLAAAARGDAYALVREAAARALAPIDRARAKPILEELAAKDPEPRVRQTATELLTAK
jgi:hypothetical protein